MREQYEFEIIIGLPPSNNPEIMNSQDIFASYVIDWACGLCGGCTEIVSTGYWKDDGDQHKVTFSGETQRERTVHIKLSCELEKSTFVYNSMRAAIVVLANKHDVSIEWVHFQRKEVMAMHFNAQYEYARLSASQVRDVVSPGTRGAR